MVSTWPLLYKAFLKFGCDIRMDGIKDYHGYDGTCHIAL